MIITTRNKLKYDLTSITMASEDSTYPLTNSFNESLVRKTKYTSSIIVTLDSSTNIDYFAIYSQEATQVQVFQAGPTITLTTSYDGWFFSDEIIPGTAYTVTLSGSGDIYINYLYIGDHINVEYMTPGTVPNRERNDISNISNTKQRYRTSGVSSKFQSVSVPDAPYADWKVFDDWQKEVNAVDKQFFLQWEDDPVSYPPYYASIEDYNVDSRSTGNTDTTFSFNVKEAF
jgi:hypothetical protein